LGTIFLSKGIMPANTSHVHASKINIEIRRSTTPGKCVILVQGPCELVWVSGSAIKLSIPPMTNNTMIKVGADKLNNGCSYCEHARFSNMTIKSAS